MVADCRAETGSSQQTSLDVKQAPISVAIEALCSRGRLLALLVLALCSGVVLGRLWAAPDAQPVSAVPDRAEPSKSAEQSKQLAQLQARVEQLDQQARALSLLAGLAPEAPDAGEQSLPQAPIASVAQAQVRLAAAEQQWQKIERQAQQLQNNGFDYGLPVLRGELSSGFGLRTDPISGQQSVHLGLDFAARAGTAVIAAAPGVVVSSRERADYGHTIEIRHLDGHITLYAHNQRNLVDVGDQVQKGQTIAIVGRTGRSTGYHVHFEVLRDGQAVDPRRYIARIETEP